MVHARTMNPVSRRSPVVARHSLLSVSLCLCERPRFCRTSCPVFSRNGWILQACAVEGNHPTSKILSMRCRIPRKTNQKTLRPGSLQAPSGLHPKHRTAASFLAAMSAVFVALMLPTAQAATLTWAGGASNTWNSTSSWSPAQIPVNGDDLIFNTASANAQNNFANNALTLNSIAFNASSQTLSQNSTNGILIGAGGVTVGNSLGNSQMVLPVTLNASQTWSVGTGSTLSVNRAFAMGANTLTKTGAGTLRLTNNLGTSSAGSQILVQNGILEALYQNDIRSTTGGAIFIL